MPSVAWQTMLQQPDVGVGEGVGLGDGLGEGLGEGESEGLTAGVGEAVAVFPDEILPGDDE